MPTSSRLTVASICNGYRIDLSGKGTLFLSPVFQELAERCLSENESRVVVSLTACEYLDSTFLGCLVSLHRKYNQPHHARFEIVAPVELRDGLLRRAHLDQFFSFAETTPELVGEPVEVPVTNPGREIIGKHVEEAHRHLAQLGGAESTVFAQIAQNIASDR